MPIKYKNEVKYMGMFYECPMGENTPEDVTDKFNLRELVEFERYCRDYMLWDQLHTCYHDEAHIVVSWMEGTIDEFIEGSRHLVTTKAPAKHKIFDTLVWKHGRRAIVECITAIQIRCELDDDLVDLSTHTRLHYRAEKRNGIWKLLTMDAIYEKDTMKSAFTDGSFTASREELAQYRPTYANMMLRQVKYGGHPNGELAGEDRPESITQLYESSSNWLGV